MLPTAQTALLDEALTLSSEPPVTVGEATTDQVVPLKFSISGATSLEELGVWKPTAQMSVGETAETALKPDPATVGVVTTWKPLEVVVVAAVVAAALTAGGEITLAGMVTTLAGT